MIWRVLFWKYFTLTFFVNFDIVWDFPYSSFWRNREKEVVVVSQPLSEKAEPKDDRPSESDGE